MLLLFRDFRYILQQRSLWTQLIFCTLCWLLTTHRAVSQSRVVSTIQELNQLSEEQTKSALPTELEGIITHVDQDQHTILMQDETGATQIRYLPSELPPKLGYRVRVSGTTSRWNNTNGLTQATIKPLKQDKLPEPRQATLAAIEADKWNLTTVQVRGKVLRISRDQQQQTHILIGDSGKTIQLRFPTLTPQEIAELPKFHSTIVAAGLVLPSRDRDDTRRHVIQVPSAHEIEIVALAPADLYQDALTVAINKVVPSQEVLYRVRGKITLNPTMTECTLKDETGQITLSNPDSIPPFLTGDYVEAVGFGTNTKNGIELRYVRARMLTKSEDTKSTWLHTLHSCAEIRALSRDTAAKELPARLRGVITHTGPMGDLFLQDATGGTYIRPLENFDKYQVGDMIVLDGYTCNGGFSPELTATDIRVLGQTSLPTPEEITPADVLNGRLDTSWVKLDGIAQRITFTKTLSRLWLSTRLGQISIEAPREVDLGKFLDREVRVVGIYVVNQRGQSHQSGFRIIIAGLNNLTLLDSQPQPLFGATRRPINQIMDFQPEYDNSRRIRVGGVVTAFGDDNSFFLQDDTGGMFVLLKQGVTRPKVGEHIEVSGYLDNRQFSRTLREGVTRPSPEYFVVQPQFATSTEILDAVRQLKSAGWSNNFSLNSLVRIRGTLLTEFNEKSQNYVKLKDGDHFFSALIPNSIDAEMLKNIPIDSTVELTGVCKVQYDAELGDEGFVIILRDFSDFAVIEQAPWLTRTRTRTLIISMVSLLIIGAMGLGYLRYRLRKQGREISERLRRELQLEARYREMVENATDVIFTLDSQGMITSWNRAGEMLMGLPREQLIGQQIATFTPNPKTFDHRDLVADNTPRKTLILTPDQRRLISLELTARPVIENQSIIGIEAIGRDVTERDLLEQRQREVAKMQAVGQLAGGVAHDFNNLLTVINGNTELLLNQEISPADQQELLEEIQTAGSQAAAVTRQLLAFGRKTVINPKVLSINHVLDNLARVLKRLLGEPIRMNFVSDPKLNAVRLDPSSLEQAILNLVVNARDAMPSGGTLTISTRNLDRHRVQLEVVDTGHGMPDQIKSRIFEPYFTTKPAGHGTGLGLAMVAGFVEQSEGKISVESQVNVGTRFTLEFKAVESESIMDTPTPQEPATLTQVAMQHTILLVEDEPSVQLLERRILESGNYRVIVASSAEEAIEMMGQYQGPLDLLVSDVVMPGKNGRELWEELRRRMPDLRVVFLSGYTPDEVLREGIETNAVPFLQKPFAPSELLRTVRQVLHEITTSR